MREIRLFGLNCFLFLLLSLSANGQTILEGKITDKNTREPLIGAYLIAVGTNQLAITDNDGSYKLTLEYSNEKIYQEIEISYVGYVDDFDFVKISPLKGKRRLNKNYELKATAMILKDVVVTANKVEENLQNVPIAISVVDKESMKNRTVSTTDEALQLMPNILTDVYLPSQPTYSIRGLSTNFADNGAENEIGLYIDDVYYSRAYSFNTTLMDIERIEVLRGPQGTLFGKNTVGGVIHIISENPKMGNFGAVELNAGNFNFLQLRGKVNFMPIKDKLALRLTAAYKNRNGWLREENPEVGDANKTNSWGTRGSLLYQPNDRVTVTIKGNYNKDNAAEFAIDYMVDTLTNPDLFQVENGDHTDRVVHQSEEETKFFRESYGGVGKIVAKIGEKHELTSISAYNVAKTLFYRDFDVTPTDGMSLEGDRWYRTLSQELRVSTPRAGQKFFYVAGLYFLQEEIQTHDTLRLFNDFQAVYRRQFDDPSIDYEDYKESGCTHGIINSKSYAAFVSSSFEVSDRVKINAGIRYTYEIKKASLWQDVVPYAPYPGINNYLINIGSLADPIKDEAINGAISGNIGLDFQTTDKILLYVNAARGFKGAGFNIALNPEKSVVGLKYDPEYLYSYELGLKYKYDDRFLFNAAVFVMDYKNKQEAVPVGAALTVTNAKSAQGVGFEGEFTGLWTKNFRTDMAIGVLDLAYFDFAFVDRNNNPINLNRNKLYKAPNFTFKFSPELEIPMGLDTRALFRLDYNYIGKAYNDVYNTESIARQAAGTLNGRIAFSMQNDKYSIALWGKNLTNELVIQHGWILNIGNQVAVNPPRTVGVELRVNFY